MQIYSLPPFVHLCCFVLPYVFCLRIWSQTTESKSIGMSLWKFFRWLQWVSFKPWNSFLFLYIKVWCFVADSLKAVALQLWYVQWLQDCALSSLEKLRVGLAQLCSEAGCWGCWFPVQLDSILHSALFEGCASCHERFISGISYVH